MVGDDGDGNAKVWIDSHSHLQFRQFDTDRAAVIERARAADVATAIVVGTDPGTSRAAVQCAEQHGLYAAVGLHPHDASRFTDDTLVELRELLSHPRVVALGEIGLDYARNYSPRDAQLRAFAAQLDLAAELGTPVVVHCRNAAAEVAAAIDRVHDDLAGGVLHCFSSDAGMVARAREWGFHISAAGHITRPANGELRDTFRQVSLDMLLVETDCPYLLPSTVRRKGLRRNEPAFVPAVGQCLAEMKGVPLDEIARATTANTMALFGLDIEAAVAAVPHEKG